jgi:hypothetical protein
LSFSFSFSFSFLSLSLFSFTFSNVVQSRKIAGTVQNTQSTPDEQQQQLKLIRPTPSKVWKKKKMKAAKPRACRSSQCSPLNVAIPPLDGPVRSGSNCFILARNAIKIAVVVRRGEP